MACPTAEVLTFGPKFAHIYMGLTGPEPGPMQLVNIFLMPKWLLLEVITITVLRSNVSQSLHIQGQPSICIL